MSSPVALTHPLFDLRGQTVIIVDVDETLWHDSLGVKSAVATLLKRAFRINQARADRIAEKFVVAAAKLHKEWASENTLRGEVLRKAHIGYAEICSLPGRVHNTHPNFQAGANELARTAMEFREQAWRTALRDEAALGDTGRQIVALATSLPQERWKIPHVRLANGTLKLLGAIDMHNQAVNPDNATGPKRKIGVAVLTNGLFQTQARKVAKIIDLASRIYPRIDATQPAIFRQSNSIISGEFGVAKPNIEGLVAAIAAAGIDLDLQDNETFKNRPPATIVMYGDNPEKDGLAAVRLALELQRISGELKASSEQVNIPRVVYVFYNPGNRTKIEHILPTWGQDEQTMFSEIVVEIQFHEQALDGFGIRAFAPADPFPVLGSLSLSG